MTYFANGHVAKSDDAGFIMVSGTESIDFLQSILTANAVCVHAKSPITNGLRQRVCFIGQILPMTLRRSSL